VTHIAAAFDHNRGSVPLIAVAVKHGNACGGAFGDSAELVLEQTMRGDLTAVFGGSLMTNFPIGIAEAEHIGVQKLDVIIAPSISSEAIERLERKHGKCRFIVNPALSSLTEKSLDTARRFRYVRGGFLVQDNYTYILSLKDPTIRKLGIASRQHEDSLLLAWAIGSTSNSNTVTLVVDTHLIGNGVNQQDRVGAAELAGRRAERAKHEQRGAVAYSDSFFPFPDGPQELIGSGTAAILTSSGSVRDQETVDVCKDGDVILYMVPDEVGRGFYGH
jgi:phosphoribosylaminoimidazolecarboxamide formyltransferase/IMP cyclohydrolase